MVEGRPAVGRPMPVWCEEKNMKVTKKQLREAAKTRLEKRVADWACSIADDYDGDPCRPLREVLQHGCASGVVTPLIYYKDTERFYRRYEAEIWDLVADCAARRGERTFSFLVNLNRDQPGGYTQVANMLAWFGFEEAAYNLASALKVIE
jgi:hypothetical protein